MSRMWDTPDFWARGEAHEALRDMPDVEPAAMAHSLKRSAASYGGDPETVALIATDLRRRAAAGIRFWTGPEAFTSPAAKTVTGAHSRTRSDIAELMDDEIPS